MKRPEGFDGQNPPSGSRAREQRTTTPSASRRPAEPPRRPAEARTASRRDTEQTPDAAGGAAPRARATAPERPAPRERPARVPRERRPTARLADDARAADRAARREHARALRAKQRYEHAEMRRFTRRSRHRRTVVLTVLGIVTAFAVAVAVSVFSPVFELREIRIEGAERVPVDQLQAALDGQLGTPLPMLDDADVEATLATFPLIRSFVTEALPPHTLVVRIREREPVGVVARDDGRYDLVDPAGVVIETSDTVPDGLPVIVIGALGTESAAFGSIGEVLLTLPGDVAAQVDSVSATTRDDVTFTLRGSEQRVLWGSAERGAWKSAVLADLVARHAGDGPGTYDVSARETAVFNQG